MLISVLLPQPFGPNTEMQLAARDVEVEAVVDDGVAEMLASGRGW